MDSSIPTRRTGLRSLTMRRALASLAAAATVLLVVGTTIGFNAASATTAPSSSLSGQFGVAAPRQGDTFEYRTYIASGPDNGYDPDTPERLLAAMQWLEDSVERDGGGRLHAVNRLNSLLNITGYFAGAGEFSYDAVSHEIVAIRTNEHETENGTVAALPWVGEGPLDRRYEVSKDGVWTDRPPLPEAHGPLGQPRPCGLYNALQGARIDLSEPIAIFQEDCILPDPDYTTTTLGPESSFTAVMRGSIGGHDAVLFRPLGSEGTPHDGMSLDIWLAEDLPYPALIQFRSVVVRLAAYSPGTAPLGREAVEPDPAPPVEQSPRQAWGPDDAGVDHPFPLSRAYERAQTDAEHPQLRDFLSTHDDAYVARADYGERQDDDVTDRWWQMVVTDGMEGILVGYTQRLAPPTQSVLYVGSGGLLPREESYHFDSIPIGADWPTDYPAPDVLPSNMITIGSAMELWQHYSASDAGSPAANAWGVSFGCFDESCRAPTVITWVGLDRSTTRYEPAQALSWTPPFGVNSTYEHSYLLIEPDGWVRLERETHGERIVQPQPGQPRPSGDQEPNVASASLGVERVWQPPSGRQAATAGLLAAAAGLLCLFWPALKTGLIAPFFSRIERPKALSHRTRDDMYNLIQAEPGIHQREIGRRLGLGHGETEHHLGKLVQVGLVVQERGDAFTCYFARGSVDRRVMAAASSLKGDAVRRVMTAIAATAPSTATQIARAAGVGAQALSYHTARLEAAGLVRRVREGREVRLSATELGRAAIGLTARTPVATTC